MSMRAGIAPRIWQLCRNLGGGAHEASAQAIVSRMLTHSTSA